MEINLIWCQSLNGVIGQKSTDGKYFMPWEKNSEDMKHFKQMTSGEGKAVLMGYNTYLSLGKKILPNRENFVLTKSHYNELNVLFDEEGNPNMVHPVISINECIRICEFLDMKELWIIGGKQIYDLMFDTHINKISKIYRTIIPKHLSTNLDTVVMRYIPKSHFRQMTCENLKTCQIQMWQLK